MKLEFDLIADAVYFEIPPPKLPPPRKLSLG